MAFCTKCGAQTADGVALCPACAAPAAAPQPQAYAPPAAAPVSDQKDIEDNKLMAILAYFGPLVFVPWFVAPNSKFAKFHSRQGMKLFAVWVGYIILSIILSFIKVTKTRYVWGLPIETTGTPWFVSLVLALISIGISIIAILGIVKAATGKFEGPPLIDKIPLFNDK
ncbi:MAG: zinc ribbon domain-containing protein [Clostridia bacterium]|nr:zinc ribbon domain-containing protein [Clostridia bacterium]